jgi:Tfp pilus assembly protein PilV
MRNRLKRPPPIRCRHYNPGVTVTELAEGSAAEHVGYLIGLFGIPAVGAILLIAGLQRRSRQRRLQPPGNPMAPPGYPPPGPYPYGYPPRGTPPPGMPPTAGYPNPPGPFQPPTYPPYYPAGYPAPRPRGSSGTTLIVVGSILLALGMLAVFGHLGRAAFQAERSARSANVGQCIAESNMRENNSTPAPAQDCDKPDSIFEVAAKADGSTATCPDGKRQDSLYAYLFDGTTTLCLMLNLEEGHCYTASGTAENPQFDAADCNGSATVIRVAKRVDGSADVALCPARTKPIAYPTPARLYCLERLEN